MGFGDDEDDERFSETSKLAFENRPESLQNARIQFWRSLLNWKRATGTEGRDSGWHLRHQRCRLRHLRPHEMKTCVKVGCAEAEDAAEELLWLQSKEFQASNCRL